MRIRDLILIIIAVAGALWTYQIKHDAEISKRKIEELKAEIQKEEKRIVLYQADWAILTSPNHLSQHLDNSSLDLGLDAPTPSQFVTLDTLPDKPIIIEVPPPDPLSTLLEFSETDE